MTFLIFCMWYIGFVWMNGFLTGVFSEMEGVDKGWKTFGCVILLSMAWPGICSVALYEKLFIDNKEKA